jgi:MYXO-CTERM domain-containing protein
MKARTLMLLVALALGTLLIAPAAQACPVNLGGYAWFDRNGDGLMNEGPADGLNGVRVVLTRDYECNGIVDGFDAIFDYVYTANDGAGAPGHFALPANGGCYIATLDPATIPAGLFATTPDPLNFDTGCADFLAVNFGLGNELPPPPPPAFACPKTIGFWKQQVTQSRAAKYTAAEIARIMNAAVALSPVFASANDLKTALLSNGNAGPLMRAKRQFAGLSLNVAAFGLLGVVGYPAGAGFDTPIDLGLTDADTLGEAFDEIKGYILSRANLGLANDLADALNNGLGIDVECDYVPPTNIESIVVPELGCGVAPVGSGNGLAAILLAALGLIAIRRRK